MGVVFMLREYMHEGYFSNCSGTTIPTMPLVYPFPPSPACELTGQLATIKIRFVDRNRLKDNTIAEFRQCLIYVLYN